MIIPPVGGLGGGLAPVQGEALAQAGQGSGGTEAAGGGFGSALTEAVSSLEKTQQSGDSAAQSLATGNVADPQAAVGHRAARVRRPVRRRRRDLNRSDGSHEQLEAAGLTVSAVFTVADLDQAASAGPERPE